MTARAAVAGEAGGSAGAIYLPGDHTVAEVIEYVAEHPDQLESIYAAEEAGKNRSTLLAGLEAMR